MTFGYISDALLAFVQLVKDTETMLAEEEGGLEEGPRNDSEDEDNSRDKNFIINFASLPGKRVHNVYHVLYGRYTQTIAIMPAML